MLVVGASGFAKEVLEILHQLEQLEGLVFYDDVNFEIPDLFFGKFKILKSIEEAGNYFKSDDNRFTLGLGDSTKRRILFNKFSKIGGILTSVISSKANIGSYDVIIEPGSVILDGAIISNGVYIGIGCIIYFNSIITHDCKVGKFVEISPNVTLLGRCSIGDYSHIGAGSTILPDVIIGKNVIVGAGSIVTKDIPNNCVVVGVPGVIKENLKPLEY